ncbi:MAG: NUDIX hydrolase [Bacteroidia bacterium]
MKFHSSAKNPWTTLDTKEIYSNPWIRVSEHQVLNPAGKPGIYGTVHFKNNAIGVVPYQNGYIWMVGQYRYTLETYTWEIPEGGSPKGESPEETAKRELKEETGLVAKTLTPILEMHLSNSVSDEWGIVYLATGLTQEDAEPEETEELQVRKVKLEEVYEAVERREITDSLTVGAIYKLMLMKEKGELDKLHF